MDHGYAVLIRILYIHKSEEEIKAIAVEGACGQNSNRMLCKTEEYHLNIEKLQLCLWIMPSYHLIKMEMYVKDNK